MNGRVSAATHERLWRSAPSRLLRRVHVEREVERFAAGAPKAVRALLAPFALAATMVQARGVRLGRARALMATARRPGTDPS